MCVLIIEDNLYDTLILDTSKWIMVYDGSLIYNQVEGYFMKGWEMFKSVFSVSCYECLARFYLKKHQIRTIEKLWDTLLPKLMSSEVRVQYNMDLVA